MAPVIRNFSPQKMFIRLADEHVPACRFPAFRGSFQEWKVATLPRVLATLGAWPQPVPPQPELVREWEDRGIRKRRYHIEVGPHISAVLQVNFPPIATGPAPAILCWHGHGPFGKEPVMGNRDSAAIEENIAAYNYDYGHRMAEEGYVTFAIDWMGCGERSDAQQEFYRTRIGGRDWCNIYYLHATMLGTTNLALNLAQSRVVTDFVASLPEVDAGRLGVMGLSGGGTITLWTALTDGRFRAAEIICYSDVWASFGIRAINYCGSQIAPGLYRLVDVADLQGLLAPLPLLIDIGQDDQCFKVEDAMACHEEVRKIYEAAGAGNRLHLDLFPGDHCWGSHRSVEFFARYLS